MPLPSEFNKWKLAARKEKEAILAEFRKNGCFFCPEKEACCLVAHHVDPSKKSFNIGAAKNKTASPETFKAELAKCICICHNCHYKLHAGLLKLPDTYYGVAVRKPRRQRWKASQ